MKSARVRAILPLLAVLVAGAGWGIPTAAAGTGGRVAATATQAGGQTALDRQVEEFLERHGNSWRDLNVPAVDGQKLHELILENGYTRAVEIGTSTGHSAVWMAWALSKTGGKLITIEIDPERYEAAVANFDEAGLSPWIDARLADAHQLVRELDGPFDFVFVDADKDWYTQYLGFLYPKLAPGGCFTAHNVSQRGPSRASRRWREDRVSTGFVRALLDNPGLETEFFTAGGGLSISFRRTQGGVARRTGASRGFPAASMEVSGMPTL